jgi:FKBP-type peptidyl-prolyl cis-trans isomerase 2
MKKTLILLFLITTLFSCNIEKKWENIKDNKELQKQEQVKTSSWKIDKKLEKKEEKVKIIKDAYNYVGFVWTFCPHCQKEMPILEEFYKENKGKVNMLMIVIDNKKFNWYTIPQKKQSEMEEMSYEKLTWEKCWYVPSYIIYDNNKKIIAKKCGWALDKKALKKLLIDENKNLQKNSNLNTNNKKNMIVKKWDNVSVHYIWKTKEDWKEFDNSYKKGSTLDFTVGAGQMIKGFDEGVIWMKIWEKKIIEIAPKDAYGEYSKDRVRVFEKKDLADFEKHWIKLEVWSELPTQMWIFKIIAVDDKKVTVDTNHPLAWKTLIFEVEMVDIK